MIDFSIFGLGTDEDFTDKKDYGDIFHRRQTTIVSDGVPDMGAALGWKAVPILLARTDQYPALTDAEERLTKANLVPSEITIIKSLYALPEALKRINHTLQRR